MAGWCADESNPSCDVTTTAVDDGFSWVRPWGASADGARCVSRTVHSRLGSGRDGDHHQGRVVGPAVLDAVAQRECAVQENEVQIVHTQRRQQARRLLGGQRGDRSDVGVGGADSFSRRPWAIRARVSWRRRCTRAAGARRCGGDLHRRSPPPPGHSERGDPLGQGVLPSWDFEHLPQRYGSPARCAPTPQRPVTWSVAGLKTLSGSPSQP